MLETPKAAMHLHGFVLHAVETVSGCTMGNEQAR